MTQHDMAHCLRDIRNGSGDTALHLLGCGQIDDVTRLLRRGPFVPPSVIKDLEQFTNENKYGEIAQVLLDHGCSIVSRNYDDISALETLLKDFQRVYVKKFDNADYVQILNVFLKAQNDHAVVSILCARDRYMTVLRHLYANEAVNDDMRQLVVHLRNLQDNFLKVMLQSLIHTAMKPDEARDSVHELDQRLVDWFDAIVKGVDEEKLKEVFSDSDMGNCLKNFVNASNCASPVLRAHVLRWHFPDTGNSLLHHFVATGNKVLITTFFSSNTCRLVNFAGQTSVFLCKDVKTLQLLYKLPHFEPEGQVVDKLDNHGNTPLKFFAQTGRFNVAIELLRQTPSARDTVLFDVVWSVVKIGNSSDVFAFVKAFLDSKSSNDVNLQNQQGQTALMYLLHLMVEEEIHPNHVQHCKNLAWNLLNHHNIDQVDSNGKNILMYAISLMAASPLHLTFAKEIFQKLLSCKGDKFDQPDKDGRNLLIYAILQLNQPNCKTGSAKPVVEASIGSLIKIMDVNTTDNKERSPLIHAVLLQSEVTVKSLLAHGADPNCVDVCKKTAACYAFMLREPATREGILQLLVAVPTISLTICDEKQQSLVHKLALNGHEDMLKHLLRTREEINLMKEDEKGNCPVYLAIKNNAPIGLIKELICDRRFSIFRTNSAGKSVVDVLGENGQLNGLIGEVILTEKFGPEISKRTWCPNSIDMARQMAGISALSTSVEHFQDKLGRTALMALESNMRMTDLQLVSEFTVNLKDSLGQTVVHYMLDFKLFALLSEILKYKECDIYATDNSKMSAVLKAVRTAPCDIIEAFFRHPQFDVLFVEEEPTKTTFDMLVDATVRDDGETEHIIELFHQELQKAVKNRGWEAKLVKMFLKVPHCAIDTEDEKHGSALNYAMATNNMELSLHILEQSNPDVNKKGADGYSPLVFLILSLKNRSLDECTASTKKLLVVLLEHRDLDVNQTSWSTTPLKVAIDNQNTSVIEALLTCRSLGLQKDTYLTQRFLLVNHVIEQRNIGLLHAIQHHPNFEVNTCDFRSFDEGTPLLISVIKARWTEGLDMLLGLVDLCFDIEDADGDTPLMLAIIELPADDVRKMLDHPNCNPAYQNKWNASVDSDIELEDLLKKRKISGEDNRIRSLLRNRRHSVEVIPRTKNELRAAIEAKVEAFKSTQNNSPWQAKEKEEIQFLIHVCVENILAVTDPEQCSNGMIECQRKYFQHYPMLVDQLLIDDVFLTVFVQHGVLTLNDCDEIRLPGLSKKDQAMRLLRKLMYAGDKGYEAFKKAVLENRADWIIDAMEASVPSAETILQQIEQCVAAKNSLRDQQHCLVHHTYQREETEETEEMLRETTGNQRLPQQCENSEETLRKTVWDAQNHNVHTTPSQLQTQSRLLGQQRRLEGNHATGQDNNRTGQENNCTDQENNRTDQENNCTNQENNRTGQENNHTSQENNCTSQENNRTNQENNRTDQENNRTGQENNHTSQENNCTGQENNHTSQENNHTSQENNRTCQENNHTGQASLTEHHPTNEVFAEPGHLEVSRPTHLQRREDLPEQNAESPRAMLQVYSVRDVA